jgi:hypothetical protein
LILYHILAYLDLLRVFVLHYFQLKYSFLCKFICRFSSHTFLSSSWWYISHLTII